MEQIETQVSDLRYLTQMPVPLPSEREGPDYSPPASAMPGDNSALAVLGAGDGGGAAPGSAKRKSEDEEATGSKRQRSKRNRVSYGASFLIDVSGP